MWMENRKVAELINRILFKDRARIRFEVLPLAGPEYFWDVEPLTNEAFDVTLNIFSCH
jgi:hypothetical protein